MSLCQKLTHLRSHWLLKGYYAVSTVILGLKSGWDPSYFFIFESTWNSGISLVRERYEEQRGSSSFRGSIFPLESSSLFKTEFQWGCSRLDWSYQSLRNGWWLSQDIGCRFKSLSDREGSLALGFPYAASCPCCVAVLGYFSHWSYLILHKDLDIPRMKDTACITQRHWLGQKKQVQDSPWMPAWKKFSL